MKRKIYLETSVISYGNNLDALFKDIQLGEARLQAAGIQVLAPPVNPANMPGTALQRNRFAGAHRQMLYLRDGQVFKVVRPALKAALPSPPAVLRCHHD